VNVELIKIDPAAARAKLRAYKKGIAARMHKATDDRVRKEYEQIEAGYKAAARGLPLIELTKAMAMGGWDEIGRPKFAVARADLRKIRGYYHQTTFGFEANGWERKLAKFEFRTDIMPPRPVSADRWWRGDAIVPMVPADVMPRPDLDLSRRVILWEADWKAPPVDPMLLLPIGGDLYAVEAAWDLTPLERAVIEVHRDIQAGGALVGRHSPARRPALRVAPRLDHRGRAVRRRVGLHSDQRAPTGRGSRGRPSRSSSSAA
jgi:hypothetical protein